MALPFMPFYWGDYWRDTAHLTDAEHVAYLKLISHYWQHGGLPTENQRLARIAGRTLEEWLEMRPVLSDFFQVDWKHKRIERDLARQNELKDNNAERAKRAANARWNAPSIAQALPEASLEQCLTNANQNHNQNHNHNHIIEPKAKSYASRGTRLPEDWKPSKTDLEFADGLGVRSVEGDKFRDHWHSQPSSKGVKVDWSATWRNWCRNAERSYRGNHKETLRETTEKLLKEIENGYENGSNQGSLNLTGGL